MSTDDVITAIVVIWQVIGVIVIFISGDDKDGIRKIPLPTMKQWRAYLFWWSLPALAIIMGRLN